MKPANLSMSGKIRTRRTLTGLALVAPAVIYFAVIYYFPLLQSFLISLYEWNPGRTPRFAGLAMYGKIVGDPLFWLSVKNSFYFTLLSVPITVICSLFIAALLDRVTDHRLRNLLSGIYLLPQVISLVAAALIWEWLYNPVYGLFNHLLSYVGVTSIKWLSSPSQVMPSLAIMSLWLRLGFDTIIFLAALQAVPGEYHEAASIDGAGEWATFKHITLPLLNPQVVFVAIVELIFAFRVFDQVYAATKGGPANASRVIILHLYETAFKFYRFGEASAMAVLFFVFLLVVSILQLKFFRRTVEY